MISMEDVHKCLDTLESGEEFVFVYTPTGFRTYTGPQDNVEEILVILTPLWYDLTYCSNEWDDINLLNELSDFYRIVEKLNDDFISTKFTVVWR
jgi:hypothetical protein